MNWFKIFRMTKNGTVPQYKELPAEVRQSLDHRRDEIAFIEEQRRIVVRLQDAYMVWQYNPLKEEWILVSEKRMS